jgi:hypothetical protein
MTYTNAQNALKKGLNAAPLKRGDVAEIARAAKAYKLKNDVTINNRKKMRKAKC